LTTGRTKASDKRDEPMKNETESWRLRLLGSAGVILLGLFLYMHWTVTRVSVPPQIVGTWTTTDAAYAGRSFEIGPETVNFGTGRDRLSTGFIYNVEAIPAGTQTLYTLSYTVNHSQEQVSFYCDLDGKTIRFRHQEKTVWVKSDED
jgi:hypothetical protein